MSHKYVRFEGGTHLFWDPDKFNHALGVAKAERALIVAAEWWWVNRLMVSDLARRCDADLEKTLHDAVAKLREVRGK